MLPDQPGVLPERDAKSEVICRALLKNPDYMAAASVAVFDAMASEPSLELAVHEPQVTGVFLTTPALGFGVPSR